MIEKLNSVELICKKAKDASYKLAISSNKETVDGEAIEYAENTQQKDTAATKPIKIINGHA